MLGIWPPAINLDHRLASRRCGRGSRSGVHFRHNSQVITKQHQDRKLDQTAPGWNDRDTSRPTKHPAVIKTHQRLAFFRGECQAGRPEPRRSPEPGALRELQCAPFAPGVILEDRQVSVRTTCPNDDPALPKTNTLKGPTTIPGLRGSPRGNKPEPLAAAPRPTRRRSAVSTPDETSHSQARCGSLSSSFFRRRFSGTRTNPATA